MASVPNSGSSSPPPIWGAQPAGSDQVAYGGFWIRFVAYIIDAIILSLAAFFLAAILGVRLDEMQDHDPRLDGITFVIGWVYFAAFESSRRGATPGKMAMGLRVVTGDGQRLSFLNATGRYFAKIVSALILCIGFIMIGFTERKRGLHDMMANTLVIKVR